MPLKIYCDGSGDGGYAFVAYDDKQMMHHQSGNSPGITSNEAEYNAVLLAMQWLAEERIENVTLFTDSRLVAMQYQMKWKCKAKNLRPYLKAIVILGKERNYKVEWISREENVMADFLASCT